MAVLTLTGAKFSLFTGLCLYIWKRGGEYLYIGLSDNGLRRLLYHNIIGRAEAVQPQDTIEVRFFPALDFVAVEEKERRLVKKVRPKYNSWFSDGVGVCQDIPCIICGVMFRQSRHWQRYCSARCRNGRKPTNATP